MTTDKQALLESLREALRAELRNAERVALDTAAAANHPEARPENDKDTRKIELSYLAAGQAARARELEAGIALLAAVPLRRFEAEEAVASGALVQVDVGGREQRVFLAPAGGGLKLAGHGGEISVVTPQSPLGRGLLGKTTGDVFELAVGPKKQDVEVLGVE
jgi:transcription elongation GreA/GreB family factor